MFSGTALLQHGDPVASMGVDFRDYDNDGLPDLAVTALIAETFPLFRNAGDGYFEDATGSFRNGGQLEPPQRLEQRASTTSTTTASRICSQRIHTSTTSSASLRTRRPTESRTAFLRIGATALSRITQVMPVLTSRGQLKSTGGARSPTSTGTAGSTWWSLLWGGRPNCGRTSVPGTAAGSTSACRAAAQTGTESAP